MLTLRSERKVIRLGRLFRETLFVLLEKDDEVIFAEEEGSGNGDAQDADDVQLNFRMVFDFATTAPLEKSDL